MKFSMVERYRRKSRQKLLGNHQKCWIWGKNPVMETLRAEKWMPVELLCSQDLPECLLQEVEQKTNVLNIPITKLTPEEIQKKCHTREHQGLAAKMPPFPYTPFENLPDLNSDKSSLLLILDSIQDPHNLGAIIRTAEVLGSSGIIIGETNQAGVSSQVVRSSAGAVNHLPIVQTDDLEGVIRECQSKQYSVIAASEKSDTSLESIQFQSRTVLIIGNEGTGIRKELLELADDSVSIRQAGVTDSLNAAISASILIYEYHRQQDAS